MIKFFRRIRQNMLKENRTSKYLLYAFGEIILVVIGILIALQINNWNEKRIESENLNNYYQRMHEELESSRDNLTYFQSKIDKLVDLNKRSLELINLKNRDSLILLKETLGALGTAYTNNFNFPIVEEFINEGYLARVKNIKIKNELQAFSIQLTQMSSLDTTIMSQYIASIEPYFNKHINYAEVALNNYRVYIGGPETDYQQFYNDLELWNILNFKLESLIYHQNRFKAFKAMIERLTNSLANELELQTK